MRSQIVLILLKTQLQSSLGESIVIWTTKDCHRRNNYYLYLNNFFILIKCDKIALFLFQLLSTAFEKNSLDLIFYYVDLKKNTDGRLALEALKVP